MNSNPSETTPTAGTVLTFFVMMLICMGIVVGACVRLAAQLDPTVGDIAVFTPGRAAQDLLPVNVTAQQGGGTCVLASDVIAQTGGSFVVIARETGGDTPYVVHWAGPRTSSGAADCGGSADLVVSKRDLLSLASVAGGFGIHPDGRPRT